MLVFSDKIRFKIIGTVIFNLGEYGSPYKAKKHTISAAHNQLDMNRIDSLVLVIRFEHKTNPS